MKSSYQSILVFMLLGILAGCALTPEEHDEDEKPNEVAAKLTTAKPQAANQVIVNYPAPAKIVISSGANPNQGIQKVTSVPSINPKPVSTQQELPGAAAAPVTQILYGKPILKVLPRPITIDTPYREKEIASGIEPAAVPSAAIPKPSETAPKPDMSETQVEKKPPVIAEPIPAAAPKPAEPDPAPIAVATPLPNSSIPTKPEAPNPDSQGGLLARRAVYYEFDAANLSDDAKALVIAHAKFLAKTPNAHIKLRGNCDERGSREYNISLGSKRSESVKQLMIANGASAKQIDTESFGKEKPMALGHDEQSWSKNRRVDIVYGDTE
jgi:peptidoglycan-associated lipoprotein